LYPDKETKQQLKKWFGCVRSTYNWALASVKDDDTINKTSLPDLRKLFVNRDAIPTNKRYLLDTPKHVRDGAIADIVNSYKSNFAKKKINPNHKFDIKFRSKKEIQAITIPHDAAQTEKAGDYGCLKMYPTYLKNRIKYLVRERDRKHNNKMVPSINYTSKLVLDKLDRIYLCVPMHEPACENQASKAIADEHWASIDLGVRTFATVYSTKPGQAFKLADKDISRITRLCQHLDKLYKKQSTPQVKKARTRAHLRIKHLVDEVHWKIIWFLCTNFKHIILSPFNTSKMVKKGARKINKKVVRSMLTWSHYRFRQRLLSRSAQLGVEVNVMGEEYTTKTCTNCFHQHPNIGGNKKFKCANCHVTVDRDVVGSRNIFLKNVLACPSATDHVSGFASLRPGDNDAPSAELELAKSATISFTQKSADLT
jgi:putative transposase